MLVHVERLRAQMAAQGLDAIIAASLENVHYFTGVYNVTLQLFPYGGQCYAIVTADQPDSPFIICPTIDADQFVMDSIVPLRGMKTYGTFYREDPASGVTLSAKEQELQQRANVEAAYPGPGPALIAALTELGLTQSKLGVDDNGLSAPVLDSLTTALPQARFEDAVGLLRKVRRVKTAEEIRRLKASAHVTENAIIATAGIVREGVTEIELVREFERSIVSQGGKPRFAFIRIGRRAVAGQSEPTRTPLAKGDVIWFDVGCVYQGYWSDLARNVSLGEPDARTRQIYRAMLQGEEQAIAQIRAGMSGRDAFNLTMGAARSAGAAQYRRHHVGHGIGAEVYEEPILSPSSDQIIESGSVVNIETPYYEYGLGALHVEDPFVVEPDGNLLLTALSRDLLVVE